MAKTLDELYKRILTRRIDRIGARADFHREYLPIAIEARRLKVDDKLRRAALADEKRLLGPAFKAGVPDAFAKEVKDAAVAVVEERFHWKYRALQQSKRRWLAKHPDHGERFVEKERRLADAKQRAVALVLARYAPALYPGIAKAEYESFRLQLAEIGAVRRAQADQTVQRFSVRISARLGAKIAKNDAVVAAAKSALAVLQHTVSAAHEDIAPEVLLRVEGLSMHFGGLKAVDNLSFAVKKGEIFGLIGPNGAGKTTVFNCITRFYRATAGEMLYRKNDFEVIKLSDYPVHDIIRQGIVRTFQNVELVWELTILDNLLVAAHTVYRTGFFGQLLHTRKLRREEEIMRSRALGVLRTLGLSAYAYVPPYGLPYGILEKVELARTLMAHPRLIILDEPAAGLNDKETADLAILIKRIRDDYQTTIFLVEHDMGLVMDVCDTVCAISFGKMLAIGTPAEIQADKAVRSAYLGEES